MDIKRITTLKELEDLADAGALRGLFDLPIDLYHAGPGISSSGLKALLRSPAHYAHYVKNRSDSAARRIGSLSHTFTFEPHTFESTYAVADCATSVAKAFATTKAANPGKTCVCRGEVEEAREIANAILANELASQALLSPGGHNEISVYWVDAETGVLCRARADRIMNGVIFDLKTCQDARQDAFRRDVVNYMYHLSAAFYFDGFSTVMHLEGFTWVPVEKVAPHGIKFYPASDDALAVGRAEYAQALRAYQEYQKHTVGPLPVYAQRFETLELPNWYAPKVEAAV